MSNRIELQAMRFEALFHPKRSEPTLGYILFDDEDLVMEDVPGFDIDPTKPLEFLQNVYVQAMDNSNEKALNLFDYMDNTQKGITINGTFFDYEEVKEIIAQE